MLSGHFYIYFLELPVSLCPNSWCFIICLLRVSQELNKGAL